MSDGRLVIGTKRYSSWSLRGWLAVRLAGLDVEEVVIPLASGTTSALTAATPAGLVPFLEHRGVRIWDSLSIAEYCAECQTGLWPEDRVHRALLRSASAEMHSGFSGLRTAYPAIMGVTASPSARQASETPEALADLRRISALWEELLDASRGPYLHGSSIGIADAMFAPVATRIRTWGLTVPPPAAAYVDAIHAHPLMLRWHEEVDAEPKDWRLERYEAKLLG